MVSTNDDTSIETSLHTTYNPVTTTRLLFESECLKRDETTNRTNKILIQKPQMYLICVGVLEGRNYSITNMDSCVIINVGKKRKRTKLIKNTDNPYYKEYYVFEFYSTIQKIMDINISFTVIQPKKCCRRRKILGYFKLDVGTIWNQPNHVFIHKWAVLRNILKDGKTSIKGYLKLDLAVVTRGKNTKFPVMETGDLEDNLLLPEGITIDRVPVAYIFKLYKAEVLMLNDKKIKNKTPSAYVQISFAGLTGKTSILYNNRYPNWNTQIVVHDLYPPLAQRILIKICYHQFGSVAEKYLNLKSICSYGETGFLPTFGPDYIQLYTSPPDIRYVGRLLMEIETVLFDIQKRIPTTVTIEPIGINKTVWKLRKFLLFFVIHSVTLIDEEFKGEEIHFEISMGSKDYLKGVGYMSKKYESIKDETKQIRYIDLEDVKPCLSIVSKWPESTIRLHRENILRNTYHSLKYELDKIEHHLDTANDHKAIGREIEKMDLISVIDRLLKYSKEFVSKASQTAELGTQLDKNRLYLILYKIEDCWPDVFVHMFYQNRKVGVFSIPARKIIYSESDLERGRKCGAMIPIDLNNIIHKTGELVLLTCRMNVQFWLGPFSKQNKCFDSIPDFFELQPTKGIPQTLIPKEKTMFECLVYVLEGRFIPGADDSGLADPFVRVIFGEHVRQTKVKDKTLYPIWNETLVFQKILLDGNISYIKENPPILHLEIFDQDRYNTELFGRSCIQPTLTYGIKSVQIKLRWYPVYTVTKDLVGEILASSELIQIYQDQLPTKPDVIELPQYIKPSKILYRMEVLFWGVRELKCDSCCGKTKPSIRIECGKNQLHSNTIKHYKNFSNFTPYHDFIDIELPEQIEYMPMIGIKMFNAASFGKFSFIGICMQHPNTCLYTPLALDEYLTIINEEKQVSSESSEGAEDSSEDIWNLDFSSEDKDNEIDNEKDSNKKLTTTILDAFKVVVGKEQPSITKRPKKSKIEKEMEDRFCMQLVDYETIDWWTKFYNSLEDLEHGNEDRLTCRPIRLKIYPNELENQKEFNSFSDQIYSYKIYRGKRTGDEILDEDDVAGVFKGCVKLYKWITPALFTTPYGGRLEDGIFQHVSDNNPDRYIARIYVIRGLNIRPMDWNGYSDSYVGVSIGGSRILDKNNVVTNQVNPIFGSCFEIEGSFPNDTILTVSIWDKDLLSSELVGETKIDLEKRWFTKHRAHCGLPSEYIDKGRCKWRDQKKPTRILKELCRNSNLDGPTFFEHSVRVGPCTFISEREGYGRGEDIKERLSLMVLRRWKEVPLVGCHLVPEHVETRTLYHPSKPGLEQGKIQLWIDLFDAEEYIPRPVDVKPHQPQDYQLRVIIWNTEDVILQEDDFFIGKQKSDIYVKGWITDPDESQRTDVHFNSITGEGNFNWRFVFPFTYLPVENKLIINKKESILSDETIYKKPCRLHLQILDNDTFSADDFLGAVQLDLSKLPRGAKSHSVCNLNQLFSSKKNTVNLFKTKIHKGWWPCWNRNEKTNERICTGKIEMELELLTKQEAEGKFVGLGRDPPYPLPEPKRPDISFAWFRNPFKLCKYTLKAHKFAFCFCLMIVLGTVFVLIGIYSIPSLAIKKILHL